MNQPDLKLNGFKINQRIQHYHSLHLLLMQKQTGCSSVLAKRLGISRSHLFYLIDELRLAGVMIEYNRLLQSYEYTGNKQIKVHFIEVVDIDPST